MSFMQFEQDFGMGPHDRLWDFNSTTPRLFLGNILVLPDPLQPPSSAPELQRQNKRSGPMMFL